MNERNNRQRKCCTYCLRCCIVHATAVNTGAWTTGTDSSNVRRAGDKIVYTVVTTNNGTATLKGVEVTDTSGDVSCAENQPVAELDVGDSFTCLAFHQVSRVRAFFILNYFLWLFTIPCICRMRNTR